jgi:uncharacterized protein with beta-barrel porin domain
MNHSSFHKSGALLALPAALSFGVVLAPAAAAQSVISTDQFTTVDLAHYTAGPVSITAGTTLSPARGPAVLGSGTEWTLTNAGDVTASTGIQLNAGGSVTNSGTISASAYGVLVQGGPGSVANTGLITAGWDGVSLNGGGGVTNSGSIHGGHIGVYTGNGGGTVSNSGTITASEGDAVSLYGGGSFTNTATGHLTAGYSGVYAGVNGSAIQNAGAITGTHFAVYLTGADTLTNTGSLTGGIDGVIDIAPGGVVENSGVITGTVQGVRLGRNATLVNSGILSGGLLGANLGRGSTLTNSGDISGEVGILAAGGVTILDTGTIATTQPGGDAIGLTGAGDTITLDTGALISGAIEDSGPGGALALNGTGALNSTVTGLATADLAPGADWTLSGNWHVGTLLNNGSLQVGLIGTPLNLTGNYIQGSAATILVAVSPQGSTQFNITGSAQLAGNLVYMLAPGTYEPKTENFLTATNGITGAFSDVSTQAWAGLDAGQNNLSLISASSQVNWQVLRSFTVAPRDAALFADANQAQATSAEQLSDSLLTHAAGSASPCQAPIHAGDSGPAGLAAALASGLCAAGGWVEATGSATTVDGAYNTTGGGFLAGLDRTVNASGTRLGLAVGYDTTALTDRQGGASNTNTVRLALYGAQPIGPLVLSGDIMGGLATANSARATGIGAATAHANGTVLSGAAQLAWPLTFGATTLTPQLGVEAANIRMGSFSESAPLTAFALHANASGGTGVEPFLRLSISRPFVTVSQLTVTPQLSLGLVDALGNPGSAVTATADGDSFTAAAPRLDGLAGQASIGLTVSRGRWSLAARYSAQVAGNWSAQSAQAELQVAF